MRLLLHASTAALTVAAARVLDLDVAVDSSTGAFDLSVGGAVWLRGAGVWLNLNGQRYSARDGSLELRSVQNATSGTDALGAWDGTTLSWAAGGTPFETRFRVYRAAAAAAGSGSGSGGGGGGSSEFSAVVFEQAFPEGAGNLSVGDKDALASAFPAFDLLPAGLSARGQAKGAGRATGDPVLGFTQWASFGTPGSQQNAVGLWPPPARDANASLAASWERETGALALFSEDLSATVVLSPLTSFDAWGQAYTDNRADRIHADANATHTFEWGARGTMEAVPPGFTMATIVAGTAGGINQAMIRWGDALLQNGGAKQRGEWATDISTSYLGWTTANGAYYYYNTEPGKNYEQTILDLKTYVDKERIPVRWVLYDSWFYSKTGSTGPNPSNGCTNWTDADPAIFPSGLRYMYDQTGWPVVAHSRAWSAENVYLNRYDWVLGRDLVGDMIGLPTELRFWRDLIGAAKRWGCLQYQQDWMYTQQGMTQLQASTELAEQWQTQMNTALSEEDMRFGFGGVRMSNWLHSTTYPTATNGRATDDYEAIRKPQWQIGVPSIFTWALDTLPYKDGFWTTPNQPGHPYNDNRTEPYAALHAAAATFTRAQVTPSDGIGFSDRALIMRSCMEDGRLLQPAAPARTLDLLIAQTAFNHPSQQHNHAAPDATSQVWGTVSIVPGAGTFFHLLTADLPSAASLLPSDLRCTGVAGSADVAETMLVFENANATSASQVQPVGFSATEPLQLAACAREDFKLYHAAPILQNGWALLGEVEKWVPVSAARFQRVEVVGGPRSVVRTHIAGAENETIAVDFASPNGTVTRVTCTVSANLAAVVSSDGTCEEP